MKILFLTFYYEPDLSAGSFRSKALVWALVDKISNNDHIELLTTFPNRYASYKRPVKRIEKTEKLSIVRFKIPEHKSGMLDQAISFISYYIQVIRYIRSKDYNIVYSTSSRLLTAYLGATISKRKNIPLFLDIRDIFTDTLGSILKHSPLKFFIFVFKIIEKKTILSANRINLVSEGFKEYFESLNSNAKFSYITNGIDDEFLHYNFRKTNITEKKVITYAGNIGKGQGLEKIIPELSIVIGNQYLIQIFGDGGMRSTLEKRLKHLSITNVKINSPVNRTSLLQIYKESDYLLLHLNDYDAFNKVLPSKIFEYAATGKPIIAGVSGYSRKFIRTNLGSNWLIFQPANISDFKMKFQNFNDQCSINYVFTKSYNRATLMDKLADEIIDCTLVAKNKS